MRRYWEPSNSISNSFKTITSMQKIWIKCCSNGDTKGWDENPGLLTSFHWGSVVSLKTRVLALLTKYPNESTSSVQYRSKRKYRGERFALLDFEKWKLHSENQMQQLKCAFHRKNLNCVLNVCQWTPHWFLYSFCGLYNLNINHHFKSIQIIFIKDRKGSQFWGGPFFLV